ncbi:hypothetical protein OC846_002905 [Tilletia horrida]|uniref:Uncharacterized protein n=1 Tax=Tilletia horrida TaxID=155126 RepID=A0AAN6GQZ1_9BASI|nr:hypothetical protein OC846_002905 [Tilletia horrida]
MTGISIRPSSIRCQLLVILALLPISKLIRPLGVGLALYLCKDDKAYNQMYGVLPSIIEIQLLYWLLGVEGLLLLRLLVPALFVASGQGQQVSALLVRLTAIQGQGLVKLGHRAQMAVLGFTRGFGSETAVTIASLDVQLARALARLAATEAELRNLQAHLEPMRALSSLSPLPTAKELAAWVADLQGELQQAKADLDEDLAAALRVFQEKFEKSSGPHRWRREVFKHLDDGRFHALTEKARELGLVIQDDSRNLVWHR